MLVLLIKKFKKNFYSYNHFGYYKRISRRAMVVFFLILLCFANQISSMNNGLPKPTIVSDGSSKQDPQAYKYSAYYQPQDFQNNSAQLLFDSDSLLTDQLIDSIYQMSPPRIHELIAACNANFKSKDSFPTGCLLLGPSGCGKTALAKVIALKLNRPYKLIKTPHLFDSYKNSTIEKLTTCISTYLSGNKKCVLIFDEINAITDKQEVKNDQDSTAVSAFWLLLDDCFASNSVFIIGTTNKKAADLPSQFQTRFAGNSIITMNCPDTKARFNIIKFYLDQEAHDCNESYVKHLVKKTNNKSTREIKALVNQAAQKASLRDALKVVIKKEDLESVLKSWPSKWPVSLSYETLKPYLHQLPAHVLPMTMFFLTHRFQQKSFEWQKETSSIQIDLQKQGLVMQKEGIIVQKDIALSQKYNAWGQSLLALVVNLFGLYFKSK